MGIMRIRSKPGSVNQPFESGPLSSSRLICVSSVTEGAGLNQGFSHYSSVWPLKNTDGCAPTIEPLFMLVNDNLGIGNF